MPRVLAVLAAFGLLVYAFSDFASSDEEERGDIPRWLWLVIIVLLPYFGPVSWIAFSRSRRAQAARAAGPAPSGRPTRAGRTRRRATGPVAPDDDPDFLWRLAQEQRRQSRGTPGTDAPTGTTPPARPGDGSATGTAADGSASGNPDDAQRDDETRDDGAPA